VVEKGRDFVVQFPSIEKLKMMMEFDEFRLKALVHTLKCPQSQRR
jgi:hypothetical protein